MDKYKKLYKQIIKEGRNNISFSDLQFFLEKTGFSVRCKGKVKAFPSVKNVATKEESEI